MVGVASRSTQPDFSCKSRRSAQGQRTLLCFVRRLALLDAASTGAPKCLCACGMMCALCIGQPAARMKNISMGCQRARLTCSWSADVETEALAVPIRGPSRQARGPSGQATTKGKGGLVRLGKAGPCCVSCGVFLRKTGTSALPRARPAGTQPPHAAAGLAWARNTQTSRHRPPLSSLTTQLGRLPNSAAGCCS